MQNFDLRYRKCFRILVLQGMGKDPWDGLDYTAILLTTIIKPVNCIDNRIQGRIDYMARVKVPGPQRL